MPHSLLHRRKLLYSVERDSHRFNNLCKAIFITLQGHFAFVIEHLRLLLGKIYVCNLQLQGLKPQLYYINLIEIPPKLDIVQ